MVGGLYMALHQTTERALVALVVALCFGTTCGFRTKTAVSEQLAARRHKVEGMQILHAQDKPEMVNSGWEMPDALSRGNHVFAILSGYQQSLMQAALEHSRSFREAPRDHSLWLYLIVAFMLGALVILIRCTIGFSCFSRKHCNSLAVPLADIPAQRLVAERISSENVRPETDDTGRVGHQLSLNSDGLFPLTISKTSSNKHDVNLEPEESPDETDDLDGEDCKCSIDLLKRQFGDAVRVCILGDSSFVEPDTEELVKAMARELAESLGVRAVFITAGLPGVQHTFAKNCGDGSRLVNLLPLGVTNGYGIGMDIEAGGDAEDHRRIFDQLGNIYITVEGGAELAKDARVACARGAGLVPVVRTGGASAGLYSFPPSALRRPSFARAEDWVRLTCTSSSVEESGVAVAAIVAGYAFMFECQKEAATARSVSKERIRAARGEQKEAADRVTRQVLHAIWAGQQLFGQWSHDAGSFFDIMDKNHKGILSQSEIGHCIRKLGCVKAHEDIWLFVTMLKTDNDGMIKKNDFAEALSILGKRDGAPDATDFSKIASIASRSI